MSNQQVKNYIEEDVIEEVYAALTNVAGATTTPQKVASGTVPAGYDGVIVSIAVEQDDEVVAWVKKKEKQIYENGLNTGALPTDHKECPLFKGILEKETWEFGLTNSAVGAKDINWLIRVRLFKKV